MRKRFRIILAIVIAALVGGAVWQVVRPRQREPVYQGKPLSFWLGAPYSNRDYRVTTREVEEALSQIGTNAIPTLLQSLRAKDSALTSKILDLAEKQRFITIRHTPAWQQNGEAAIGFQILGASAKEAVPALIEIYNQNISGSSRVQTAYALG